MRSIKILHIVSISLLVIFLPVHAEKKRPPLPLKELTNPNSPSYVPYPYPKTEFEIIEDFKYAVRVHFSPEEGKHTSIVPGHPDYSELMLQLLGDYPSLKIIQIIKVKDLVASSSSQHYFLLQAVDKKGKVVAVGRLLESGLLGGVAFYSEKDTFKPYKTENQVKKMLSAYGPINTNKMELVDICSTISSPYAPLWKISTPDGILFVDHHDNVYFAEGEICWTKRDAYPDPEHKKTLVLDTLNDKAIFLRKINKG